MRISRWQLSIYMIRREDFQAPKSSQLACGERLEASNKASVEFDCVSWEGDALSAHSVTLFQQAWPFPSLWSERTGWVQWSNQLATAWEDGVPSLAGVSLLAPENRQEPGVKCHLAVLIKYRLFLSAPARTT